MKKKIIIATVLSFVAAVGLYSATITSLGSLPDTAGVFTQANLDKVNANVTTDNTNFTNVNVQLASLAAGTGLTNGVVGTAQLNPNTIQFVSVPLTLSALQTLNSVPVQILAAQGAGTFPEIQSCTLDLKYGSAAFTNGGTVTIGYGTSTPAVAGAATIAASVFTTFASSHSITVAGALAVNANTGILNVPVWAQAAAADFAVGTGATGVLDCAYRVHTGF